MLPQLRAEEALLMAQQIAVGTGSLKKGVAEEILHAWQRDARGHQHPPPAAKASPRTLAGMGIGYRREPRRAH